MILLLSEKEFTTNEIIQYSLIGLVLIFSCIWIFIKIRKAGKEKNSGCCGCKIADTCKKNKNKLKNNGKY